MHLSFFVIVSLFLVLAERKHTDDGSLLFAVCVICTVLTSMPAFYYNFWIVEMHLNQTKKFHEFLKLEHLRYLMVYRKDFCGYRFSENVEVLVIVFI